MKLRPYQTEAIARVLDAYRAGHQGALLVCPTGGGKTVIYSKIARDLEAAGAPVLVVEPAVELVEQTRDKLARLGVERVGIVAAGWGYGYNPDPGALVQVATVQTLRSRPGALLRRPRLIIFDEAHLAAADSYVMIRERYAEARRLGVTATPWRLDDAGFDDLASALVVGPTVRDLQAAGALVPFRTRSIPLTSYANAGRRPRAEFNLKAMAEAYNRQQLVGDVIEHYTGGPKAGRSGIVFGSSTAHARELCEKFKATGVRAEYLDGQTPLELRKAILARLADGSTSIVCNFGVLTAGFDCPRVEYIGIARATASKALWIQMAGRGLRPCDEVGKVDCLIDDFGGNALRHGNLAVEHVYSLEGRNRAQGDDEAEATGPLGKACPQCQTVIDAASAECEHCGFSFIVSTGGMGGRRRKGVQAVDGELVEIDASAAALDLTPPESAEEKAARRARQSGRFLRERARRRVDAFAARFADDAPEGLSRARAFADRFAEVAS